MAAPGRIVAVVARLPVPLAAPHAVVTLPPLPALLTTHVHAPKVMLAGAVSVTVALVTSLGPLLVMVIVYVVLPPAVTLATPSVFVIARSAVGVTVSESLALLFPGIGSVVPAGTATVAVLTIVPVAPAETVAGIVYTITPPGCIVVVVARLPDPLGARHAVLTPAPMP